jgi:LPS-assembly lipoprotein
MSNSKSKLYPWRWLTLALVVVVSACGFQLQGRTPLPFDTLLVSVPQNSQFGADLRRAIRAASPGTKIVEDPLEPYEAHLQQISETRSSREVSLNAQGRVEEYELTLTYVFRIVDPNGDNILPPTTLVAVRDLPFDDNVVQAKEGEQETLFKQMQKSLISRVMRRISAPDVTQSYQKLLESNQSAPKSPS